jgi:hypothetical protein
MSVSERDQAEPVHRERRMAITSFACDIMSASEPTSLFDCRVTNVDHELIIIFNLSFEEKVT